ncbi:MAG TPA: hypothetical protein VGK24_21845 [Candidatus Angelobacter sp.]|jgi:hypothetical protein
MNTKLLTLIFLAFLSTPQAEITKSPFSIAVVSTQSFEHEGTIAMAHNKARDFYVVITNTSTKPQQVFESWNSWGYQTISFSMTAVDGKQTVISKRQQDFVRNFPSTFVIQPGEHQVVPIRFDEQWEVDPKLQKLNEMSITLKAIYEVSPTPEAARLGVWVGHLESREYKLVLRQW